MGLISVAAFRARPGREDELMRVMDERLPLLRRLKLATERTPILMRSQDGVIIQVSEWTSREAIDRAHQTPEVLALWDRIFDCCEHVKLESLPESQMDFATFEAID